MLYKMIFCPSEDYLRLNCPHDFRPQKDMMSLSLNQLDSLMKLYKLSQINHKIIKILSFFLFINYNRAKSLSQFPEFKTAPAEQRQKAIQNMLRNCLLYTSPSPRDRQKSRMPSSA
eukprot:TRINITY_DN8442_c0_g1_i2.p4 TRINITY_DN8442_c0_g1~~TRINITY_DN8442_c0_g1_i2.p4  ORF type:complete len:116 (+),score=17.83 TRINITY_DN8442_c0_g1_i2:383-730(+)